MREAMHAVWLTHGLALGWLACPGAVEAHDGRGFHPEALWALLQTGFLVGVGVSALIGVLWVYEHWNSREAK